MLNDQIDYEQVRARVDHRMKLRAKFFRQLSSYITVNIFLWAFWGFSVFGGSLVPWSRFTHIPSFNPMQFPWPLFVSIFWGIGVFKCGIRAFFDDQLTSAYDRELQQEILREKRRIADSAYYGDQEDDDGFGTTKRKNGTVRLSDDGELIYDEPEQKSADRQV